MALTTNIVAYWKLDEASGNAADAVGSVTLTNTGTMSYGAAKINNGAQPTPTGSKYLSAAVTAALQITGDVTVNFWMNATSFTGGLIFGNGFAYSEASNYHGFGVTVFSSTGMRMWVTDGTNNADNLDKTISALSTGTFYMVTFVYSSSTKGYEGFINGSSIGSSPTVAYSFAQPQTNRKVAIGADFLAAGTVNSIFNGTIDEVGLWNRALSSSEISQLYNSGAGLAYPFSAGTASPQSLSLMGVGS